MYKSSLRVEINSNIYFCFILKYNFVFDYLCFLHLFYSILQFLVQLEIFAYNCLFLTFNCFSHENFKNKVKVSY